MNVTTPVDATYPVTVQLERATDDVFKNTVMLDMPMLAVLGPLSVSVFPDTGVLTRRDVEDSAVCVMLDGSGYSDTVTGKDVTLVACPLCVAPSGLSTFAYNVKALPSIGKTHAGICAFPDVSSVPCPMNKGEFAETTPDTSVRYIATDPVPKVSYGVTRNTTDVGTVR